tara:strand:- start:2986 stop:3321 length:336 start_codon:yes stop_codon:yes gene_type:complete
MCAYGSCREEWNIHGDHGSGTRVYCKNHSPIARKEYQKRRYLALKPAKKICIYHKCDREIRRQGKKVAYRKFCSEKCYKRNVYWKQRYVTGFKRQLDLTKAMLLAIKPRNN